MTPQLIYSWLLFFAEGVIARKLFPLQLIICAAPAYLALHGAPDNLNALATHRCSVFRSPRNGKLMPWNVKVEDGIVEHHVVPALCVNDEPLLLSTWRFAAC